MPHKKRKTRKKRGSRTHGYGQVGQHRGGDQRGGHGKAGLRKDKWTHTIKYAPERLRKHGFKPPIRKEASLINVGKLDEQIDSLLENKQAEKTKKGIKVYLNCLGYDKLLGKGQVTHPLIVQVKSCSKSAAEKIEKAGGKILGTKQQNYLWVCTYAPLGHFSNLFGNSFSRSGRITSTISSAIFTASSKYCLFSKLGDWKEETGILRSRYLRSGSLRVPITTPKIRSPHPASSIKISFPDRKRFNPIPHHQDLQAN